MQVCGGDLREGVTAASVREGVMPGARHSDLCLTAHARAKTERKGGKRSWDYESAQPLLSPLLACLSMTPAHTVPVKSLKPRLETPGRLRLHISPCRQALIFELEKLTGGPHWTLNVHPPFTSPPGGALILSNKDDLAGQFSRLVGRGWSFMAPDQSPLAMAQLQARADPLI